MFKFNFQVEEECLDTEKNSPKNNPDEKVEKNKDDISWFESKKHLVEDNHRDRVHDFKFFENFSVGSLEIKLLDEGEISASVIGEQESLQGTLHSDLIKGVYEGGLKIWECAKDLAEYVESIELKGVEETSILDLGCGAGLPGLVSLFKGARSVDFQDYNPEVIDYYTIPNVLLNHPKANSQFFSGDWGSLKKVVSDKKYDIILTSETIYNIDSQDKLISVFDDLLKPGGYVLLGSKIHYFGVGGGLRQFEDRLKGKWSFMTVKTFNESGIQREIIKISRQKINI